METTFNLFVDDIKETYCSSNRSSNPTEEQLLRFKESALLILQHFQSINIIKDNDREYLKWLNERLKEAIEVRKTITKFLANGRESDERWTTWHSHIDPILDQIIDEIRHIQYEISTDRNFITSSSTLVATIGAVIMAFVSVIV